MTSTSAPEADIRIALNQPARTATGTHFVASQLALLHVSALTRPAYRRLMPYRWKEDLAFKASEVVWREDMADFVLENMREGIIRDLRYLSSRPAAYIASCKSYESVSAHEQISAVVWLGHTHDASSQHMAGGTAESDDHGPPIYAMLRYKGHYVPYYNLCTLLGTKGLGNLRDTDTRHFRGQLAVIKAKRPTVKVQLSLWKLVGYLAQETDMEADRKH